MNERIKVLAERAGSTHKQNLGVYQFYTDELEKFAELIVQECIDIIAPYTVRMNRPGEEYLHPILEIKQHFGVEEQEKVAPKPKCSVCGTTENVKYMGGYQPYLCDSIDCIPF
jgi:hypothetical protein